MSYPSYILSIALFMAIAYSLTKKSFQKKAIQEKSMHIQHKPITPENTIITFDLHDVIVNYDYSEILHTFLQNKNKLKLIIAMLNPFVWWDIAKLTWQDSVAEQYIVGLGEKYTSLKPFIPLGTQIANCQRPNPRMVKLLEELKQRGYTLHLFSNIGAQIFEDFKKKFPELIELFDMISIPSKQNGYSKKPHDSAFTNYLKKLKNDGRQIIFVDDKVRNLEKAHSHDITGILFTNTYKLRAKLEDLGLASE